MSYALRHTVAKRTSISLTAQNLDELAAIKASPAAPTALSVDKTTSDAAVLHRVFELGVARAQELLDEVGYAALANDPERAAFQRTARARRRG